MSMSPGSSELTFKGVTANLELIYKGNFHK